MGILLYIYIYMYGVRCSYRFLLTKGYRLCYGECIEKIKLLYT